MEIQKYQGSSALTLSEIITSEAPSLALLSRQNDKELTQHLDALLIEVSSVFKLSENKTLTDLEILEATQLLKTEFYFLKWADLLLFVKEVKLGYYNDIYNRFDLPTFFQMLRTYCEKRTEKAVMINRVKQEELKREPISEKTQVMIKEFLEKNSPKKVFRDEKATDTDKRATELRNEFLKLYKEQEAKNGFIDVDGEKLNLRGYIEKYYLESL